MRSRPLVRISGTPLANKTSTRTTPGPARWIRPGGWVNLLGSAIVLCHLETDARVDVGNCWEGRNDHRKHHVVSVSDAFYLRFGVSTAGVCAGQVPR